MLSRNKGLCDDELTSLELTCPKGYTFQTMGTAHSQMCDNAVDHPSRYGDPVDGE
jgi:hypothetical protein